MAQARMYMEAIGRAEKRKRHDQLWLMRAARADEKDFNKALESLKD